MKRQAIHRGGHAMLAHAIMDIAAAIMFGGDERLGLGLGVVGGREVGRAADQLGDYRRQRVEHRAGRLTGRYCIVMRLMVT